MVLDFANTSQIFLDLHSKFRKKKTEKKKKEEEHVVSGNAFGVIVVVRI